jgi:Flp pilus assembly protein TadB
MINAEYIMILFQDPLGQTMVTVGGMLMICGAAVTKRMVTVRI